MASDTRALRIGTGVLRETADVFRECFGDPPAVVVADTNTFCAAGRFVMDVLRRGGVVALEPFVFDDPDLHACHTHVERLQGTLGRHTAVPIAVGSGTINDLTKLASHRCNRAYMTVATAASMDGYTAYGASITHEGSKQTFFCPAPRAVIADMDVICAAPAELNAAGYGDLVAKIPAGADWLLADALGVEAIEPQAWSLVQGPLRQWVGNPDGIRCGDREAIGDLVEGLLMAGFAMQWTRSSRPASGAEHQFSHLWDMQDHRHHGRLPLHGCKVAVGTVASTLLYEALIAESIVELDVARVCEQWPEPADVARLVQQTHERPELRALAVRECEAKYVDRVALGRRLRRLKDRWSELRLCLRTHMMASFELRQMLQRVGAPCHPSDIGIDLRRMRRSYTEAQQIRRRYTVLDLAMETGLMPACLDRLFGPDGPWSQEPGPSGP
jgi:glycerol-1-phosphate dehydrogenase [NAD(P)+]